MTHTAKHTPGPWVAHHSGIGDATVVAECGWVNKDGTPFNPTIVSRIDWPTANLIAAAPAMYEALLGCLKVARAHLYDVLVRHEDHDGKVPKGIAEIDAARMEVERLETVLAQAEGRQL